MLTNVKTLSFSKKLVFIAADRKTYSIFISGTHDNSLFSANQFLIRNEVEDFDFVAENDKPIMLVSTKKEKSVNEDEDDRFDLSFDS